MLGITHITTVRLVEVVAEFKFHLPLRLFLRGHQIVGILERCSGLLSNTQQGDIFEALTPSVLVELAFLTEVSYLALLGLDELNLID